MNYDVNTDSPNRRSWLPWLGIVLVTAVVVHLAAVWLLPRAIMATAHTLIQREVPANSFYHAPPVNHETDRIVRSSPDLIYSACAFDLSEGPIAVRAPLTGSYMSLSAYDKATNCFFFQNDRDAGDDGFSVVIVPPGAEPPKISGMKSVQAPSETGLLLFRNFKGNGERVPIIEDKRRQATCEVLKPE